MINLRDWSINDWLDWAAKNNRYLLIAGNFNIDKKHIEISGFTLFKRYIKVEGNLDEIDIDDNDELKLSDKLIFEGEYKNGQRWNGKEYSNNGELLFEGEFFKGKRWNILFQIL